MMQDHLTTVKSSLALVAAITIAQGLASGQIISGTCGFFNINSQTSVSGSKAVEKHALLNLAQEVTDEVKKRMVIYDINCNEKCIRSCCLHPGSKAEPNQGDACTGRAMATSGKFDLPAKTPSGHYFECTLRCRPSVDAELECHEKKY